MTDTVAALFVQRGGIYWDRPGVDAWDEERDARLYDGPHPVVAHPPCARWCRLAKQVEWRGGQAVGADGGTFAFALATVRRTGGVLEHPAWSLAWAAHGLTAPPLRGWHRDMDGGWCCEVSQAAYGHQAPKLTWLYYVGQAPPPPLDWSRPKTTRVVSSYSRGKSTDGGGRALSSREASATPAAFADLLIEMAKNARR